MSVLHGLYAWVLNKIRMIEARDKVTRAYIQSLETENNRLMKDNQELRDVMTQRIASAIETMAVSTYKGSFQIPSMQKRLWMDDITAVHSEPDIFTVGRDKILVTCYIPTLKDCPRAFSRDGKLKIMVKYALMDRLAATIASECITQLFKEVERG